LSEKRKLPAFLLCLFFGMFGVHRYYVGKVATGLLQLFTVGGLGVWVLFDLLVILLGGFTDKEGKLITKWV
jgi:TM2 domain-containing membrane protein YozV